MNRRGTHRRLRFDARTEPAWRGRLLVILWASWPLRPPRRRLGLERRTPWPLQTAPHAETAHYWLVGQTSRRHQPRRPPHFVGRLTESVYLKVQLRLSSR